MGTEGKIITCKAAVAWDLNSPVKVETVQVLVPTAGHVRVKMVATALCHSDLALLKGFKSALKFPYVIGHEGAGIVESVGSGVTHVKPGDKVFTMYFPHCGKCRYCLSKRINFCLDIERKIPVIQYLRNEGLDGLTSFKTVNGKPIYHGYGAASFAEYTVIPWNSCVKVNPETNLLNGCIMACGFLTGYGSSTNTVDIQPGDTAAVWGLGGVGLACVVGCKDKKAGKIIGIDVNSDKEAFGRKFGCTDFIGLGKQEKGFSLKENILKLVPNGIDFAFVCIGSGEALQDAISCLGVGGTVVMVGVAKLSDTTTFPTGELLSKKTFLGTNYGDYSIFEDIPKMVDRYVAGQLPVDDFITNTFKLEQINSAIDLMKNGIGIRSVVHF